MNYSIYQEKLIHQLAEEKIRSLYDDRQCLKDRLSESQAAKINSEIKELQELSYQSRLNRQINI